MKYSIVVSGALFAMTASAQFRVSLSAGNLDLSKFTHSFEILQLVVEVADADSLVWSRLFAELSHLLKKEFFDETSF